MGGTFPSSLSATLWFIFFRTLGRNDKAVHVKQRLLNTLPCAFCELILLSSMRANPIGTARHCHTSYLTKLLLFLTTISLLPTWVVLNIAPIKTFTFHFVVGSLVHATSTPFGVQHNPTPVTCHGCAFYLVDMLLHCLVHLHLVIHFCFVVLYVFILFNIM